MSSNPLVPRYSIELVREKSIKIEEYTGLSNSRMAADIFKKLSDPKDRELLMVATLDSKNKIIGVNVVSVGSLASSIVHPREVLKMAIQQNAAAIIIGHNHPSGEISPSHEDRDSMGRMLAASKIMGIRLLDAVIVNPDTNDYFSFADAGLLQ